MSRLHLSDEEIASKLVNSNEQFFTAEIRSSIVLKKAQDASYDFLEEDLIQLERMKDEVEEFIIEQEKQQQRLINRTDFLLKTKEKFYSLAQVVLSNVPQRSIDHTSGPAFEQSVEISETNRTGPFRQFLRSSIDLVSSPIYRHEPTPEAYNRAML